jgi:glycosyltransferase involved in cell wall biosynthesis
MEFGDDVVYDSHFAPYGPHVLRPKGVKAGLHVRHFHGPWADESRVAGQSSLGVKTKYLLERFAYSTADIAIVLSEPFRNILTDDYGFPSDRVFVVPPGVHAYSGPNVSRQSRSTVCVRRLEKRMGIDVLLAAWAILEQRGIDCNLTVVGTGSAEEELKDQAKRLKLQGVVFAGRVSESELSQYYRQSVLSVVPSVALEGFGLIALESLAAGTPVVVTNVGGLPDAVRDLDPTLIVPPHDPQALADRIAEALDGSVPSYQQCESHASLFSWDAVAKRHLEIYSEFLA